MPKQGLIELSFKTLTTALEILEHYRVSLNVIQEKPKVSKDFISLEDRLREVLLSHPKPLTTYQISMPIRQLAFLKKLTFQYFIALLKQNLAYNTEDDEYYQLYKKLNSCLNSPIDEVKEIRELLKTS
jgi:hypothetical protein